MSTPEYASILENEATDDTNWLDASPEPQCPDCGQSPQESSKASLRVISCDCGVTYEASRPLGPDDEWDVRVVSREEQP